MARLFGTDGVRGIANRELTAEMAYKLGQAGATVLANHTRKPTILIGRDPRISSDMLEGALMAGICSVGAHAATVGVIPTPGIAYLVRELGMDAGVVISASHNSVEYNGIKFFDKDGFKLPDHIEDEIEKEINKDRRNILPIGKNVGGRKILDSRTRRYMNFLVSQSVGDLSQMHIAIDCANGASSSYAPQIFEELGARVTAVYNHPDGWNINDNCGSTHPDKIREVVLQSGADIGLAFDGDADRFIACDSEGKIIDGDVLMGIIAADMKRKGKLAKDTLVVTVMSNMGLEIAMKEEGIQLVKTAVGDRYVVEEMVKNGYNFGGEQSGHILFGDYTTTGDGILTAIKLINIMLNTQKSLAELAAFIKILPQCLVNANIDGEGKKNYMENKKIAAEIKKLEEHYEGKGRLLIRPSGTEPLVRIMIEGTDQMQMEEHATSLAKLMEAELI